MTHIFSSSASTTPFRPWSSAGSAARTRPWWWSPSEGGWPSRSSRERPSSKKWKALSLLEWIRLFFYFLFLLYFLIVWAQIQPFFFARTVILFSSFLWEDLDSNSKPLALNRTFDPSPVSNIWISNLSVILNFNLNLKKTIF